MNFFEGFALVIGSIVLIISGLALVWTFWEAFRHLVLGFEKTRITRLEEWQEAWQPHLERLEKQEALKTLKKMRFK